MVLKECISTILPGFRRRPTKIRPEKERREIIEQAAKESCSHNGPVFSSHVPIEVVSLDGLMLFTGKLSEYGRDELVIIRIPGMLNFPILSEGSQVKVRGYGEEMEPCNMLATVSRSDMTVCRLSNAELIPYEDRRGSFRQPLGVPAALYEIHDTYLNRPKECCLLDISGTGAGVASSHRYEEGSVLRLRAELYRNAGYMSFPGEIVRVEERENGEFVYGILFFQLKQRQINDLMSDIKEVQKETRRMLMC